MKRILFSLLLLSLVSVKAYTQAPPLTADQILKEAYAEAAFNHKKVIIIFHASWCGWCHRMDSSMNDASCKKYFDENFVVRHLVVDESKDKKELENPGANELRTKYHGDGIGIPFWLIMDDKGNLLADSKMRAAGAGLDAPGDNMGCPAQPNEVAYFIATLKKITKLSTAQELALKTRFEKNAH